MLTTKDIAVVILNWNGKALLEQFLPSIVEYSKDATIYVADNASEDDSIVFVTSTFPNVKLIKNAVNGGYAKGYNDALKAIEAPILCLLNNDVEVTENWLTPIVETFNAQKNTAIIQPKILDYKQKTHFEYAGAAGGFIDKYGYPYCRGRVFDTIEEDQSQYDNTIYIFWASGACLFIRNDIFRTLQGFDESFFAHMEEIDLCWRAYNSGYMTTFVHSSVVFHLGGATLNNSSPRKTYLNFRNSLYALLKNARRPFLLILTRLILDGLAGLRFLVKLQFKHFIAILKAHFSFYGQLPTLLRSRRSLKKRDGYYQTKSIVWDYFVKNKRIYNG
ncbi:MAG: glycosyltransferase family 2 protein [Bacteroidota bacterium]